MGNKHPYKLENVRMLFGKSIKSAMEGKNVLDLIYVYQNC